ncbi:DNA cross-link repair protein pso2/snm1 [Lanmaoa asiatica]|nr:DNA cross-link repair protein pso2/snm1 [Lanmaoa asiatica]
MGPSTKKRKEPPSSRTLLDFFSSADAIKRARVRTSQQLAPSVRQTKVASREIIVIESDSDDGVYGKECKRSARLVSGTGVSEDCQSLNSSTSTLAHSEDKDAFGVPSELLRPIDPRVETSSHGFHAHQHSPVALKPDHSGSMFGVSAPLLEEAFVRNQLTKRSPTNLAAHEKTFNRANGNSVNDPAVDFPLGEWAVGDDELVSLDVLDSSTGIIEGEGEPSDQQRFCPVCSIDLTGIPVLEAQTHVNQCLDTISQNDNFVMQECTSIAVSTRPGMASSGGPSTLDKGQGSDLYSVLMSSQKENKMWVEADAGVDDDLRPSRGNRRRAPFYKVLQGMPIAVDAFCYGAIPGVTAYFLTFVHRALLSICHADWAADSHAHSDHYTNLGSKWKSGPIYCSEETAKLIIHMLTVDPSWIHPLPLDTPTIIPDTGGVSVTLIEANHCPGSCLFFFEGQQTIDAGDSAFKSQFIGSSRIFRYLHCGDFRASPRHILHPAVKGKHLDHIYLDTTYLGPRVCRDLFFSFRKIQLPEQYTFSPQPLVISACAELARRLVEGGLGDNSNGHTNRNFTIDAWMKSSTSAETGGQQTPQERVLVVVGAYSIGKERIVKAIAQALGAKIYCDPRKTAILRCQADEELHALLTADPTEANVHILPLGTVASDNLRSYLQRFKGTFSRVIGFRPTGWTYSPPSNSDLNPSIQHIITRGQSQHFSYTDLRPSQKSTYNNIQIFGVPYSEHSSFFELTCFAMSCDWGRMIPTVNVGSSTSRAKMAKWLKRWELEKKCGKPSSIQPRAADYW